ncbi:MAG: thiamine phosphate synthase [Nitrospirae bacterium]|nr:thiamine phosphate synthase [Nitrospirota bacterium]MBI3352960.1 thiamine phosphate synthase [Nitrospirota bacterium]
MNRVDFDFYLITDRKQTLGRPLKEVLNSALAGGIQAIQLREKDLPVRELLALAFEIRELTFQKKALLFINDRMDVCLSVGADGVHLRSDSLSPSVARRILGPERLIGVSCHSLEEALFSEEKGADFITLGPLYFTPSKQKMGEPLGLALFKSIVEKVKIPVFALGGITVNRVEEILHAGASGVACVSAVLNAPRVREAAQEFLAQIRRMNGK